MMKRFSEMFNLIMLKIWQFFAAIAFCITIATAVPIILLIWFFIELVNPD